MSDLLHGAFVAMLFAFMVLAIGLNNWRRGKRTTDAATADGDTTVRETADE